MSEGLTYEEIERIRKNHEDTKPYFDLMNRQLKKDYLASGKTMHMSFIK